MFQVKVWVVLCNADVQENCVPQGGVLSRILFTTDMNTLGRAMPHTIFYSVLVPAIEWQIQLGVNKPAK